MSEWKTMILALDLEMASRLSGLLGEVRRNLNPVVIALRDLEAGYVVNLHRVLEIVDEIEDGFSVKEAGE